MSFDTSIFEKVLEVSDSYNHEYTTTVYMDREIHLKNKITRICTIQHANMGGEYWKNYFYCNNTVYEFVTSAKYEFGKEFQKTDVEPYIWRFDRV